jgi:hypothetical protein
MPSNKEIASTLKEIAGNFRIIVECIPKEAPIRKVAEGYVETLMNSAALIESMRCETCRWWLGYDKDQSPVWECLRCNDEESDDAQIDMCGPQFCCCHWEGRE